MSVTTHSCCSPASMTGLVVTTVATVATVASVILLAQAVTPVAMVAFAAIAVFSLGCTYASMMSVWEITIRGKFENNPDPSVALFFDKFQENFSAGMSTAITLVAEVAVRVVVEGLVKRAFRL